MKIWSRLGSSLIPLFFLVCITTPTVASSPDQNRTPHADGGLNRSVVVGEIVTLDASGSTDVNGARLTFHWILHTPPDSGARLNNAASLQPQFTVDLLGEYTARLVVSNGKFNSEADTVTIRTGNVAPVAIIRMDTNFTSGEAVVLDGSASSDFNDDALEYDWSFIETPVGSRAALQSSRSASPSFVADAAGDYRVELTVSDGRYRSEAVQVVLNALNSRPRADAGLNRSTYTGKRLRLNGRASTDADGEPLMYRWNLLHAPKASNAQLNAADSATPFLGIDVAGLYLIQLITHDGIQASAPDTLVIAAYEQPTSVIGETRLGGTDVDGDGIPDEVDNCAEHFNPTQLDSNGDGFGNRCDTDLDDDGSITNFSDFVILFASFNTSPTSPNWNPDADFNGDNAINFLDLFIFRDFFLMAPGPIVNEFINPAGGTWHDPANWSLGVLPNSTHSARIEIGDSVSVEYSTGESEIAALRSTTDLLLSGGDLTVNGIMQVNATTILSGDGTLAGANILAPTTADQFIVPVSQSFTLGNVTLATDVTVENGASLFVDDDLTLSGSTITLASTGFFTYLRFTGVSGPGSTLGGTGDVLFGGTTTIDNANTIEAFNDADGLVVGPGITIRSDTSGGRIRHRLANGPITIQGTVISDLAGRTVSIFGAPLSIEGTLQGLNGGDLTVTPLGSGSDFSGTATMSGGGTLSFNAVSGIAWTIDAAATIDVNGGTLELSGDWINEATVIVTDGLLDIGENITGAFNNNGQWDNNGTFVLSNTTLELGGRFTVAEIGTISGAGTVIINGNLDNTGQTLDAGTDLPGTTVLLGHGGVIVGGSVMTTPLTLLASTTFTLDSVTLGADITVENGGRLQVNNDLILSGATIMLASTGSNTRLSFVSVSGTSSMLGGTGEVLFGGTFAANTVEALTSNTGLVVGPGITIHTDTSGGQIRQSPNTGPITILGTVISDVAGRTISITGDPLSIEGTLQGLNGGHLRVTFWPSVSVPPTFGGTATMSGGGTLSFNAVSGIDWTIDAAATIDVNGSELELADGWINEATVTMTDGLLDIGDNNTEQWENNGTFLLSNTTLELGGRFTAAEIGTISGAGTVIIDGSLDNTGQTLDVGADLPGTTVLLGEGGVIVGGSVMTTPLTLPAFTTFTLDNVTLGADITIENGGRLQVNDDLILSGATITLASTGSFNSTDLSFVGVSGTNLILGGTGEVLFSGTDTADNSNIVEVFNSTDGLVVGPGITIRSDTSGGWVRHRVSSNGPITIQGTVISDLAGRTVTVSSNPLSIEGTLQGLNGGHLTVRSLGSSSDFSGTATMSGGGKLSFIALSGDAWTIDAAATIDVNGGELEVSGGWINEATVTVTDGLLDIGDNNTGQWDNNGTIVLSNTTLELGGRFTVADIGTISGASTVIINGNLDNTGQTLDASTDLPGTSVLLLGQGGAIVGGSVMTTPLTLLASTTFTLDSVTLGADITIENGGRLQVNDDLILSGATITLASTDSFTFLSFVGVSGTNSTLGGTGEVLFGGTTTNDFTNSVQVFNSTDGLVVGPGITIRSHTSGGRILQSFDDGPITIQGTVISDLAGRTVSISSAPLSIEGTLEAGKGSVIAFFTDYNLTATAALNVDIGGSATTDFGRFTAAGRTANLDGTLNITLVDAYAPALSDTFKIMTFATRNDTFTTVNGTVIGGGLLFQNNYNATDVTLEVVN